MSRPIKITPESMDECRAGFEKALTSAKLLDGKFSYTKVFGGGRKKAVVYFTAAAWAKMVLLIEAFDKEVAWHGVAHRMGESDRETPQDGGVMEYMITDIVVYPQTVSGASVEMDTEKYAGWLMENGGDERFGHLFMQGHSHVNMPTTPSGVDLNHQAEILEMMKEHDFYIFMIWNKSFSSNVRVYDMEVNTLYEDQDVTVKMLDEGWSLEEFLEESRSMVEDRACGRYCSDNVNAKGKSKADAGQSSSPQAAPVFPIPYRDAGVRRADKPRTRIGAGWYGKDAVSPQPYNLD